MAETIQIQVNGVQRQVATELERSLLQVLREDFNSSVNSLRSFIGGNQSEDPLTGFVA